VNKGLLTLAALALAVAAVPASAQILTGSVPNFDRGTFNLAEAYPCSVGTYAAALNIGDQHVFTGGCLPVASEPGAAPGTLCLQRSGNILNVNCFATVPDGQSGPCFVQAFRLTKEVPGSFKCPDVFGFPTFDKDNKLVPFRFFQFGSGVRTWWSLNFTQPGTRFILEVVSVCRNGPAVDGVPGNAIIHKDTWTWRVVADATTLLYLIELMHGGAVSTLEVPCIIGEDMFDALKTARQTLADAIAGTDANRQNNIGNAIFNMEALIVTNCLFAEVLDPLKLFKGPDQNNAANIQPPGNLALTLTFPNSGVTAIAGIIDTVEHPCCCKLLVDLEWIALRQGLVGQTPTLPTF
jgi:hypothetical protein